MSLFQVTITLKREVEARDAGDALTKLSNQLRYGLGIPEGEDSLGTVESTVRRIEPILPHGA